MNQPNITMHSLLDLDRYPLHALDTEAARTVVAQAHEQFVHTGICTLPAFVRPEAAARMAEAALGRIDRMCTGAVSHNIYQEDEDDLNFLPDHPRNRRVISECLCLPDDEIPLDTPLRAVYDWDPMTHFVAGIVHGPQANRTLYRFADPLGALTVNVVRQGQQIAWHFDQAPFVVILLLQRALQGGAYEVAPESRWLANGTPDYSLHRRVLDQQEPSVLSHRFSPGSLIIHRGTYSLHRISPVIGDTPRVSALLSYADHPGATLTPTVRQAYYGRTERRTDISEPMVR